MADWLLLTLKIASVLALLGVIGSMVVTGIRKAQADDAEMDTRMRDEGHAPPETEPERTDMLRPIERDDDLDYGKHSSGSMHQRSSGYRGEHHQRIGCVLVKALLARESVNA